MKTVYSLSSALLMVFALASVSFAVNDSTSVASVANVNPSGAYAASGNYGWCFYSAGYTFIPSKCQSTSPAYCSGGCSCPAGFTAKQTSASYTGRGVLDYEWVTCIKN